MGLYRREDTQAKGREPATARPDAHPPDGGGAARESQGNPSCVAALPHATMTAEDRIAPDNPLEHLPNPKGEARTPQQS